MYKRQSIDSTNQGSDSTRVASLTVTNIDKTQPTVTFGTNGSTSYKKSQSTTVTVTNAGTSTTVSYTHLENGKYTVIVKGTKDGTERTNQKTLEIDVGEKIITNIEIC